MLTAFEMSEATKNMGGLYVSYRPGTADETVLDIVLAHNRYQFPADITGMTVVDIGAHIGSATLWCASHGATVFAYEPAHDNYVLCERNIRQNGLDAIVYELAVGVPGIRTLYLNPANTASNGERAVQGHHESEATYIAVQAEWVSLQTVLNKVGRCDILKMDCEGGEIDVIPQILGLHDRIDVVVGEIHVGQWPIPTPGVDREIQEAVASLDTYYKRTLITGCEYRWDHR
jgi:FkbM family methyltransferase